jgi:hypothetical protein
MVVSFEFAARINPMTWQVDLLRFSLLGTGGRLPPFKGIS